MIRERNKGIIPLLLILLLSCNSDIIFTDNVAMQDNVWELSNVPDFSFLIDDTARLTDVILTLRSGSDYPYRNLFLFVTISSPDGNIMTDTLEYYLADEKGNWYGKGFGDIHEFSLPYRTNVYFPEKGTYLIKIQHGMRIGDLPGIYDIGLRIEKSKL
jgi:gliding motility-associated lipoprotein GldH